MGAEQEKELYEDLQVLIGLAEKHHVGPCMDRVLDAVRASLRGGSSGVGLLSSVMRRVDAGLPRAGIYRIEMPPGSRQLDL